MCSCVVLQLLKDAGACHSLHVSAWRGDDTRVKYCVVDQGVYAAMTSCSFICSLAGVDPNSHNLKHETALHLAAR